MLFLAGEREGTHRVTTGRFYTSQCGAASCMISFDFCLGLSLIPYQTLMSAGYVAVMVEEERECA